VAPDGGVLTRGRADDLPSAETWELKPHRNQLRLARLGRSASGQVQAPHQADVPDAIGSGGKLCAY
jgi:hypothetical protein